MITIIYLFVGTHDVQNPIALQDQSEPGKLTIKNNFLLETTDLGSFFILSPLNLASEAIYRSGPREKLETIIVIGNLTSNMYQVLSYDIEPDGHPRSLPAALPQNTSILPVKGN